MSEPPAPAESFATTRWSLVLAAGDENSAVARGALEMLCGQYWYPLYVYARRQGRNAAAAEDLTQGFLMSLLERGDLVRAAPDRGRFRAYLLSAFKHFLINEWHRDHAQKRGGSRAFLPLDFAGAEGRFLREPVETVTPERLFDRQWALALLARVHEALRAEYAAVGNERLFARLQGLLSGDRADGGAPEAARDLDMSEGAVRTALYRLRQRFGETLRNEIRQTVSSAEEVDAEIAELFEVLRQP